MAVGAPWTCVVEALFQILSVWVGKELCVKAGARNLGVGEDGWDEKCCLWCKRVFDFCLRLFLHFLLNSLLAKTRNPGVKVWRESPFMKLSASVVGLASLSFCSYFSVLQRIFNPFLPALAGGGEPLPSAQPVAVLQNQPYWSDFAWAEQSTEISYSPDQCIGSDYQLLFLPRAVRHRQGSPPGQARNLPTRECLAGRWGAVHLLLGASGMRREMDTT